jgi:hypothetical protein
MVSPREFWKDIIGSSTILATQLVCIGIFAFTYLPKFPDQDVPQQITIVVATIAASLFMLAVVAQLVLSVIYERPREAGEQTVAAPAREVVAK